VRDFREVSGRAMIKTIDITDEITGARDQLKIVAAAMDLHLDAKLFDPKAQPQTTKLPERRRFEVFR